MKITVSLELLVVLFLFSCSKSNEDNGVNVMPKADMDWHVFANNYFAPQEIVFTNWSQNATSYKWDFGDGTTSNEVNPHHLYTLAGCYNITLTAYGYGESNTSKRGPVCLRTATKALIDEIDLLSFPRRDSTGQLWNGTGTTNICYTFNNADTIIADYRDTLFTNTSFLGGIPFQVYPDFIIIDSARFDSTYYIKVYNKDSTGAFQVVGYVNFKMRDFSNPHVYSDVLNRDSLSMQIYFYWQ